MDKIPKDSTSIKDTYYAALMQWYKICAESFHKLFQDKSYDAKFNRSKMC